MIRVQRLLITLVCFSLILGGAFHGCGKKGDPRPSGIAPPKAVSDLTASLANGGIVLRWTIQGGEGPDQRYRIERSEVRTNATTCTECPLEYAVLADISFNDPRLTKEKADVVAYLDAGIKAGTVYTYRITVCDPSGLCSEASKIVEIVVGPDYS